MGKLREHSPAFDERGAALFRRAVKADDAPFANGTSRGEQAL